jgi:hypothetical protein
VPLLACPAMKKSGTRSAAVDFCSPLTVR